MMYAETPSCGVVSVVHISSLGMSTTEGLSYKRDFLFMWKMDLMVPEYAYLYGFLQADGSLYAGKGNKGKLTVELGIRDRQLLERFQQLIPFYSSVRDRTRDTNFADNYTSSCWSVCSLEFRNALKDNGFAVGAKSFTQGLPGTEFSTIDYYRGLIDGDGSLGITANKFPFLSLVTCSEEIAYGYIGFLERILGWRKTTSRNKRDGAFNIAVYNEDCQAVVSRLYCEGCLSLERKAKKKGVVLDWERPRDTKKRTMRHKRWDAEQDKYILGHTLEESMNHLTRSENSVKMRLWKLRKERG